MVGEKKQTRNRIIADDKTLVKDLENVYYKHKNIAIPARGFENAQTAWNEHVKRGLKISENAEIRKKVWDVNRGEHPIRVTTGSLIKLHGRKRY